MKTFVAMFVFFALLAWACQSELCRTAYTLWVVKQRVDAIVRVLK